MVPGGVAEWLGTGLQNLLHRFNSGPRLASGRAPATAYNLSERALSSGGERFLDAEEVRGSNPLAPTTISESTAATMKLTTVTNISVDGVMQGLGGADEDRRGGFERGGWALPLFDNEAAAFLYEVYQRADAFLFGRRTYEIFAGYWGVMADSVNPIAAALNTR